MKYEQCEHKVDKFMERFINRNKYELEYIKSADKLLYLLKDFGDEYYDVSKKKENKLTHQIISHSFRVVQNLRLILLHLRDKGYMFNHNELGNMFIAANLHDIGKIITENDKSIKHDHNIIGYLMLKYLFKNDSLLTNYDKQIILEMVKMHSNKRHDKNKITIYTKILRDADLFDERCGDSLFNLLRDTTICESKNLNSYNYSESEEILSYAKSEIGKKFVFKRINVNENIELFEKELLKAEKKYIEYFHEPDLKTTLNDLRSCFGWEINIEL